MAVDERAGYRFLSWREFTIGAIMTSLVASAMFFGVQMGAERLTTSDDPTEDASQQDSPTTSTTTITTTSSTQVPDAGEFATAPIVEPTAPPSTAPPMPTTVATTHAPPPTTMPVPITEVARPAVFGHTGAIALGPTSESFGWMVPSTVAGAALSKSMSNQLRQSDSTGALFFYENGLGTGFNLYLSPTGDTYGGIASYGLATEGTPFCHVDKYVMDIHTDRATTGRWVTCRVTVEWGAIELSGITFEGETAGMETAMHTLGQSAGPPWAV